MTSNIHIIDIQLRQDYNIVNTHLWNPQGRLWRRTLSALRSQSECNGVIWGRSSRYPLKIQILLETRTQGIQESTARLAQTQASTFAILETIQRILASPPQHHSIENEMLPKYAMCRGPCDTMAFYLPSSTENKANDNGNDDGEIDLQRHFPRVVYLLLLDACEAARSGGQGRNPCNVHICGRIQPETNTSPNDKESRKDRDVETWLVWAAWRDESVREAFMKNQKGTRINAYLTTLMPRVFPNVDWKAFGEGFWDPLRYFATTGCEDRGCYVFQLVK